MMDNKLHITPYTKEHGKFILSCQMNHKILEADSEYIKVMGDAKNLEQDHLAFKEGIRFAEWLGLEREGLMKNWGFDGSDQYLYARIF
jgi:hypothetical protein